MSVHSKLSKSLLSVSISAALCSSVNAVEVLEEVVVLGSATFGSSLVSESMQRQQSSITSVNAVIDNLPGVTVNEGDVYGFDDWSTSITVRGFSSNLAEQQIGMTIDGMPNGGSNYGGGAKANRFVDPSNLKDVVVSQGTADIATRSHEALGGTLNYVTSDPLAERRVRAEFSAGEFDARRVSLRYDTGTFAGGTQAWVSYATQEATDWATESAENERDHFAAKLVSAFGEHTLSAYVSYDDTHEDNYQRIYTEAQYEQFPDTDGLTGEWAGVPYEDQLFRNGWSTLRENVFAYVKGDFQFSDAFALTASVYHHQNEGRGDWLPPYIVNVRDDGTEPHSEYLGGSTFMGEEGVDLSDVLYFVDQEGNRLSPVVDCTPTYTVENWYGVPSSTAPVWSDPSCYVDGAIPVMSFRNTHYEKDRTGLNLDGTWSLENNELRAGIWYEDQTRSEWRDWHAVDARDGFAPAVQPYWVQYDRSYPQETFKWYVQDQLITGPLTWTLGAKQFLVEVEREDHFDSSLNADINSDSDVLLSGGVVFETGLEGMEVFAGYAENFKALSDLVLERPAADLENIEPETSETLEFGLRYKHNRIDASAVYYRNDFENRLIFLSGETVTGPDFTIGTNGTYFNAGGIESEGVELSVDINIASALSLYLAYTYTDAVYLGSGDPAVDEANSIVPDNMVAGIADNLFVASIDWSGEFIYGGVSAKYTSDRFVNQSNTWVADAYTTTDIYVGTQLENLGSFLDGLKLDLIANNVFDEEYLGTISQDAAWVGGPRTISLSATLDF